MASNEDRRKAQRGWVTRCANELKELCLQDPPPTLFKMRGAITNFNKKLKALDEIQSVLEVELPDDQMNADIDAADLFRRTACDALYEAEALLEKLTNPSEGSQHSTTVAAA